MLRAEREMLGRQQASVRRVEGGKYEVGMLWNKYSELKYKMNGAHECDVNAAST